MAWLVRDADVPQSGAAAIEDTGILAGRRDFAVLHRLLPWDHGAPALLLTEAGGAVVHADGRSYGVRSAGEAGRSVTSRSAR